MHALLTNLIAGSTFFGTHRYDADEAWTSSPRRRSRPITASSASIQGLADRPGARERLRNSRPPGIRPRRLRCRASKTVWHSPVRVSWADGNRGAHSALSTPHDPVLMRHDPDGRPLDGVEVKIVDPATEAESSRRRARRNPDPRLQRDDGLFPRSRSDQEVALRGGWLHTGDRGVKLPGGFVKFLSRLKDVIRVGGENLSPMEVEEDARPSRRCRGRGCRRAPSACCTDKSADRFIVRAQRHRRGRSRHPHLLRQATGELSRCPVRVICLEALPRTVATKPHPESQTARDAGGDSLHESRWDRES